MGCSGALGAGGLAQQAGGMFSASENRIGDLGAGGGTGIGPGEEGGVSASSIGLSGPLYPIALNVIWPLYLARLVPLVTSGRLIPDC